MGWTGFWLTDINVIWTNNCIVSSKVSNKICYRQTCVERAPCTGKYTAIRNHYHFDILIHIEGTILRSVWKSANGSKDMECGAHGSSIPGPSVCPSSCSPAPAQSRLRSSVSAGYSVGGDVASYSSTRHSRAQLYVGMAMSVRGRGGYYSYFLHSRIKICSFPLPLNTAFTLFLHKKCSSHK